MASTTLPTTITEQLDRFESSLPAIPARIMRLQRTLAGAAYDQTTTMFQALTDSTKAFLGTARVSGKTVTGQVKAAGEQVADGHPHRRADRRRADRGAGPQGVERRRRARRRSCSTTPSTPSTPTQLPSSRVRGPLRAVDEGRAARAGP